MIPIHKGVDRSLVTNYRPVNLKSVVCKQMENVIASYLRQVWDKNDWLYEGQHGFRPGYSCGSQVTTKSERTCGGMGGNKKTHTLIREARSCKYLGIILRSDLSWADQVNYTVKKAWKALHFTMRILKKGKSNTKV